jgi:alkanesulfonate monooxygenase SsuD/methylene tetrahydromethanopterin reductase-like flavin-dependent oxidoreductase (luciferase family)
MLSWSPTQFEGELIAMKTTIAAGPPWVGAQSLPTAATLANERALGSTIFGATPHEQDVLRDLRDAAAHARAAAKALALARAK